jgi:hypothetical protein
MGAATGLLIFLAAILAGPVLHFATMKEIQFTVTEKERVTNRDESYYLIFTDGEVFENTDTLLSLKFNSSDIYGRLKVGETCRATVNWFRVPFLSMYRNIISADCA